MESKSVMYPCLLARDSASYKWVLRTYATTNFTLILKLHHGAALSSPVGISLLDSDSDPVKGGASFLKFFEVMQKEDGFLKIRSD